MFNEPLLFFIILLSGFYMAWNIGANDVSNAMGTSVGSGALTLFKAVIIAGVLEFCGAFFLGGNVSNTLQSGIIDPKIFEQDAKTLLFGMLSALIATALWLQIASFFGWPVSTTHAIVGSLLGFGTIVGGVKAIYWGDVGIIASSWVVSPVLSGLFSYLLFSLLQRKILFAMDPIKATRRFIPYMVFIIFFTFSISVLVNGLGSFKASISTSNVLILSLSLGFCGAFLAFIILKKLYFATEKIPTKSYYEQLFSLNKAIKHLKRLELISHGSQRKDFSNQVKNLKNYKKEVKENASNYKTGSHYTIVEKMFGPLQILSAAYIAFAHGANDVANAIGPLTAALEILKTGTISFSEKTPPALLLLGGTGIVIGLATWGWRVMETIGKKITELTPTRGFCAEFGGAVTILIASKLGLPISTTHCIVGAVLGVGMAKGLSAVNLQTLRDIVLSWVITIPLSAVVCVLVFYCLKIVF